MLTSRCEEIVEHDSTPLIARASRRHGGLAGSPDDTLDALPNRMPIKEGGPSQAEVLLCLQVSLPVHVRPFTEGVRALADERVCQNQSSRSAWTRLSS